MWLILVKFKQKHLPNSERQELTNKMLLEVEGILATIPMELSFCQNALLVSIKLHYTEHWASPMPCNFQSFAVVFAMCIYRVRLSLWL